MWLRSLCETPTGFGIIDDNITIVDIKKSVKVGEANQAELIKRLINHLNKYNGNKHQAFKLPKTAAFDYIMCGDKDVKCQVEVKVRSKYYKETIIPVYKEMVALIDWRHHHIKSYCLIYFQDRDKLYLYDMMSPPVKRDYITRKDRNQTAEHSFYAEKVLIA